MFDSNIYPQYFKFCSFFLFVCSNWFLAHHSPGARIHVLCMDDTAAQMLRLLDIPGVMTLPLADVESDEVLAAKKTRSIAEYCWTLSSALLWHVMQKHADIEL